MAIIPNRTTKPNRKHSQEIDNNSEDQDFNQASVLIVGYDVANDRLVRIVTDGVGRLATTADLFIKRISYTATDKEEYIGFAEPGSSSASAVWQIQKLTYDGSDRLVSVLYADGDLKFNNVWDDRTSPTYS